MADIDYFRKLCDKKFSLENRINETSDYELIELLEKRLSCIDTEISLIIAREKRERDARNDVCI
jgi:hypothetical protein